MPLFSAADHAGGDPTKPYCAHCAAPDGRLRTYEDIHASLVAFLCQSQGVDQRAAGGIARSVLAKLPAWKDR
jgi:hypothetical protein